MGGRIAGLLLIGAFLLLSNGAVAQDGEPDATITLSGGSVGMGVGIHWGQGVLTYRGTNYPFTVEGLLVGEVGITAGDVEGAVYNLQRLEDFAGTYASASTGVTFADGGAVTAMWNLRGVMITLTSITRGLSVELTAEGIWVRLK